MNAFKTIIIGAGVAGIGCARRLSEKGEDNFIVISKDVGGRVKSSPNGQVNYGAYYVRNDYKYIKDFVRIKRRVAFENTRVYINNKVYKVSSLLFYHPFKLFKLILLILNFYRFYKKFRQRSEIVSQKFAIQENEYLNKLYQEPALIFLKKHNLEALIEAIDPLARCNGFTSLKDISAFDMLEGGLIITQGAYEYEFLKSKFIEPINKNLVMGNVVKATRSSGTWEVTLENGDDYKSDSLVLATSVEQTSKILNMQFDCNKGIAANTFHIEGKPNESFNDAMIVSIMEGDNLAIFKQEDGTYVFYSFNQQPELETYFSEYNIINKESWNPALHLGDKVIDSDQGNGLYVIGDANISGLEDSYITGIYAANKIIKK
jgi:hypothetical protein